MPTLPALLTLAIEASNPSAAPEGESSCAVALGSADEQGGSARLLGVEPIIPAGRHADDLAPAIDRLVRRLGLRPRDLARIAVSIGPGGYTSLRMAVATAAMIAEATGATCIPVETERVVAAGVDAQAPFAIVLASKRDRAWVRCFGTDRQPLEAGSVADTDAFLALSKRWQARTVVSDRFLPSPFILAAESLGLRKVVPRFDAAACFQASLGVAPVPPSHLVPRYVREPEAVALWRTRGKAAR